MAGSQTLGALKARLDRRSTIREVVLGAQDGLLVPLGVTAGVAGATADRTIVVIAGIAEAFAGMVAMGIGAYLASRAEEDVHRAAVAEELRVLRRDPRAVQAELTTLFEAEGLTSAVARSLVSQLASSPEAFVRTLVEKKLGFAVDHPETPIRDGVIVGISYVAGAVVPILPYVVLAVHPAFVVSLVLTLLALFALGLAKGKVARTRLLPSALEVAFAGTVAGVAGYVLGTLLPRWISGSR